MSGRTRGVAAAVALVAMAAAAPAPGEEQAGAAMERIDIPNGKVTVGVLLPLGGRVVLLSAAGGENVLDSDPKYWSAPFPPATLDTPSKARR